MPYRTPPEKPVEIRIQFTPQEIVQAIEDYVRDHKGISLPEGFTATELSATTRQGGTSSIMDYEHSLQVVWDEKQPPASGVP